MSSSFDGAVGRLGEGDRGAMGEVAEGAAGASDEEIARLADVLAGDRRLRATDGDIVDIASTGGPGSLSTLLGPLFAVALGGRVAKVAVPGRPAGGLDVLGSIEGYRTTMPIEDADRVLASSGYLHIEAGREICSLDGEFFKWRQEHGFQAVPNLAIASLLAKKLAAGVRSVVFDVRVGPFGNFGSTLDVAVANSRRLNTVAAHLGIRSRCVVAEEALPSQPWIGRGEALVAMDLVLKGEDEGSLANHRDKCAEMAALALGLRDEARAEDLRADILAAHTTMLEAHGSGPAHFLARVESIAAAPRRAVAAAEPGRLRIDVGRLRDAIVARQGSRPDGGTRFGDLAGVQLVALDTPQPTAGGALALVRGATADDPFLDEMATCITTAPVGSTPTVGRREIVA